MPSMGVPPYYFVDIFKRILNTDLLTYERDLLILSNHSSDEEKELYYKTLGKIELIKQYKKIL